MVDGRQVIAPTPVTLSPWLKGALHRFDERLGNALQACNSAAEADEFKWQLMNLMGKHFKDSRLRFDDEPAPR